MSFQVTRKHAFAAAIVLAASLSGCAVKLESPIAGYTCCNLRPSYDWVSSNNVLGGPILAAGEAASFSSIKRGYYVYGTVGAQDIALRDDAARGQEDTLRWVRKIVVAENPQKLLASWPPEVQLAVRSGKVVRGMTREQVLMSLSYPSPNDTKDLNGPTWSYWTAVDDATVDITFGADGKVSDVSGNPSAVRSIEALL